MYSIQNRTVRGKVGQRVTWTSQSASFKKVKHGEIVAIVPPGICPHDCIPEGFKCGSSSGFGLPRKHESYLVKVDGKGRRVYWPLVKYLQPEPSPCSSLTRRQGSFRITGGNMIYAIKTPEGTLIEKTVSQWSSSCWELLMTLNRNDVPRDLIKK